MERRKQQRQAAWKAMKDPRFIPVTVAVICIVLFFVLGILDIAGG